MIFRIFLYRSRDQSQEMAKEVDFSLGFYFYVLIPMLYSVLLSINKPIGRQLIPSACGRVNPLGDCMMNSMLITKFDRIFFVNLLTNSLKFEHKSFLDNLRFNG